MTTTHRVAVSVLGAALALGTSACSLLGSGPSNSSGSSTASASPTPTALTADELVNKSMTTLQSATSLRLKGYVKEKSGSITVDMQLVRGQGCVGAMSIARKGSFKMTLIGKKLWIEPSASFWKSAGLPSSARSEFEGKYVSTTLGSKAFGSFGDFCDLTKFVQGFGKAAGTASGMERGATITVDGQSVVTVTDPSDGSRAYVTDSAEPQLVRLDMAGSDGGQLDFLDYNQLATITPPGKSHTIDGSKFGM
jgi:hypothetical protein